MPIDSRTNKTSESVQFDEILLKSIDEAFFSLGETVRQAIYFHLEEQFQIKEKQIPKHLKKFQAAIEKIFGSGARFLEILIMKNLYRNIGEKMILANDCSVDFVSYMNEAKKTFVNDKKTR
jgi:superoxide dismutase